MLLNTLQESHKRTSARFGAPCSTGMGGHSDRTLMPNVLLIDPTETTRISYLICTNVQRILYGALDTTTATLCC